MGKALKVNRGGGGAEMISGTTSPSSASDTLTIAAAKGKENIILKAVDTSGNTKQIIVCTKYINVTQQGGYFYNVAWNKTPGTLTCSAGYNTFFNPNWSYTYEAW